MNLVGYDPDGGGGFPAADWQLVASGVGLDGTPAGAFDVYDLMRSGSPLASVAVQVEIFVD